MARSIICRLERSIEIQGMLDSDIQMQLDECVRLPAEALDIERAMEMSLRWADRCKTAFGDQPGKAMFGIVQGGDVPALRVRSAKALSRLDLKGYAIGGLCRRRTAGGDAGYARHYLPGTARGKSRAI